MYEVKGSLERRTTTSSTTRWISRRRSCTSSKLELICEDAIADLVADVIRTAARTGQENAGWICVVGPERVVPIDRA